jgi:hypothetical protein
MSKGKVGKPELEIWSQQCRHWGDVFEKFIPDVTACDGGVVEYDAGEAFGRVQADINRLFTSIGTAIAKIKLKELAQGPIVTPAGTKPRTKKRDKKATS